MEFLNKILDWIRGVIGDLNTFLLEKVAFDTKILGFYESYISPLKEWVKIVGIVALAILLIFGIFGFIKKLYKLFIVLIIIGVIIGVVAYFL